MKHKLAILSVVVALMGLAAPGWAQATRTISIGAARGEDRIVTVDLHEGHGVTLNFRPAGGVIRRAWLDDPSQVTLDFDDARCATTSDCAATMIHLRRIHPLAFPGLPATETTLLTVVTDQDLFTFQLAFPDAGVPSYSILNIQPEPEQPRVPGVATGVIGRVGVQQVERGLEIAQQQQLISSDDPLWKRIQAFLDQLERGTPLSEAAREAGVSEALVLQLARMGRQQTDTGR